MPSLTFQSLTLYQFKHITTPRTFTLSPYTLITGDNFTGKTTIAEALCFTCFGTTPTKSPSVDAWFPGTSDHIRTQVTLQGLDQASHTIVRERSRTKTTILLDGQTAPNQDALTPIVGTLDLFQPAFFPLTMVQWKTTEARAFWTQLLPRIEPTDILSVLGPPGAPLRAWTADDFAAMDLTLDQTQKTIKHQTVERERLIGAIGMLDSLIAEADGNLLRLTSTYAAEAHAAAQAAIATAEAAVAAVVPPQLPEPNWSPYYQAIAAAETQYRLSQQAHPPDWQDPEPIRRRIQELETLLAQHAAPTLPSDHTVTTLRQQYLNTVEALKTLTEADAISLPTALVEARQTAEVALARAESALEHHLRQTPVQPPTHPVCPTCQQPLPPADQDRLHQAYTTALAEWTATRDTLQQNLATLQQTLRTCDDHDAAYRLQIQAEREQRRIALESEKAAIHQAGKQAAEAYRAAETAARTQWQTQHDQWQREHQAATADLQRVLDHNAQLPTLSAQAAEQALQAAQAALTTAQAQWNDQRQAAETTYRQQLAAAQAQVQAAQTAVHPYQQHHDQIIQTQHQGDALRMQHATQSESLETIERELQQLRDLVTAITAYQHTQTEMEIKPLREALTHTEIELWKQNKTSGVSKPVFRLTYDQRPVEVLSTSERLACAAELTYALSRLTDTVYPAFLDNAESSTHWPSVPGQCLVAEVEKGAPLTVQAIVNAPADSEEQSA